MKLALVFSLFLPAAALAATTYDINFGLTTGTNTPTSGSFTYDPTTGFSDFTVVWDGLTFDLTSAANTPDTTPGPTGCTGESSDNAQFGFAMMSKSAVCNPPVAYGWDGTANSTSRFGFSVRANGHTDGIAATSGSALPPSESFGSFTITAVPEPASLALIATGLLVALLERRRIGLARP